MAEIVQYIPTADRAATTAYLETTLAKRGRITVFDMHRNIANVSATCDAEKITDPDDPFMHTPDYAVATGFFPESSRGIGSSQLIIREKKKKEEIAIEFVPIGRSSIFYWLGNPERRFSSVLNWRDRSSKLQIVHDVFVASAPAVTQDLQVVQVEQVPVALST